MVQIYNKNLKTQYGQRCFIQKKHYESIDYSRFIMVYLSFAILPYLLLIMVLNNVHNLQSYSANMNCLSSYTLMSRSKNELLSQSKKDLYLFNYPFLICRCFHFLIGIFSCYALVCTNAIK